jgi:hypothetical protein
MGQAGHKKNRVARLQGLQNLRLLGRGDDIRQRRRRRPHGGHAPGDGAVAGEHQNERHGRTRQTIFGDQFGVGLIGPIHFHRHAAFDQLGGLADRGPGLIHILGARIRDEEEGGHAFLGGRLKRIHR